MSTRVDAAHVRAGDPLPREPEAGQTVGGAEASTALVLEQIRTQAAQLAVHLQRQQSSLDHRESELNARLAAMENQLRSARLWLGERHAELSQRTAELERREAELAQRETQASAAVEPRDDELSILGIPRSGGEMSQRQAELDRRQAELDSLAAQLAGRLASGDQTQALRQMATALEARRENLERAEKMLSIEQDEFERQRQLFVEERARLAEQAESDRRRLKLEDERRSVQQDKLRHELQRQSDELAARQGALERMRSDLARSQNEALEIRLATEELWSRLCGTMAPAALTQSLAQIRLKLAEEGRLMRDELGRQKAEIQMLASRLVEQHQKLTHAREEAQSWTERRQSELEKQSGLLAAEQQRIDQERAEFQDMSAEWKSERFRLQQEIRRLVRQLNQPASVAA
ncbi:MAG TPA: hypothetical protein VHV08_11080 [Pirellulales bacterium]|nr:hypothetical protein [Pirellulales bacterium]